MSEVRDGAMTSAEARVIAARIEGLQESIARQGRALDKIEPSLSAMVRNEHELSTIQTRLGEGARSMAALRDGLKQIELDVPEKLGERLQQIEKDMPGLKELRRYVVGGVVTGIGLILAALMKLVFVDPGARTAEAAANDTTHVRRLEDQVRELRSELQQQQQHRATSPEPALPRKE